MSKSLYLNGPSSIIAKSGTIQGKYFKAFNSYSVLTESLAGSSYLGYNSLGLEETTFINASSGVLRGGGFCFHNKTQESASPKLLMCINGNGNGGIGMETPTTKLAIVGNVIITNPYSTSSTLCVGDIGINDTTSSYRLVNLTRLADDYERAHLAFIQEVIIIGRW